MKALLAKDLPWLCFFLVGGTLGLVLAMCSSQFVSTFVVSNGRLEELFHVAWASGLGLGIVGFCFDEWLGTRDYLRQRPLRRGAEVGARLAGCALVLFGWFVLAPAVAYAVFWFIDPSWQAGHWQQLPAIWGSMLPAVSACAIGACAAALPFAWWARIACVAPMLAIPFSVIFWLERGRPSDFTSWPWFAGGHLVLAALAVSWLWAVKSHTVDADRPITACTRRAAIAPALAVVGAAAAIVLVVLESNALVRLAMAYPSVLVHEGKAVLAVRPDWTEPWQIVDGDHRPTGERIASAPSLDREGPRIGDDMLRIEAPRRPACSAAFAGGAELIVDADGTLWLRQLRGELQRIAMAPGSPRCVPGTHAEWIGDGNRQAVVLIEPDGVTLWRFVAESATFERLAPPPDDRVRSRQHRSAGFDPIDGTGTATSESELLLRGERFVYALRGNELHRVGRTLQQAREELTPSAQARVADADYVSWTLHVEGGAGEGPFTHRFAPRTITERGFAGIAFVWSAARPPVLQALSVCMAPPPIDGRGQRWHWLFDPLVVAGRRWWLAAASLALATALAWTLRRRLKRLRADASTTRFWTIATLLLGPIAALACAVLERPRAYANRAVAAPAPPPRIVTADSIEENVA
jgi:hypothetical protein